MLRVAVPNKGTLSDDAVALLKDAGYKVRSDSRQLLLVDEINDVEFFYLRPRDIATYVGKGTIDLGITGLDLLLDSHSDAVQMRDLGFATSTFRFAAKQELVEGASFTSVGDLQGKRVATSYSGLLRDYLNKCGVEAEIVHLDGAVETAISLGVADCIADVVSTGTTLKRSGLNIFGEPILSSQALLIRSAHLSENDSTAQTLLKRIEGVLTARAYILMDYDIPTDKLEAAITITPGFAGPTVSDLGVDGSWRAVRSLVPRDDINQTMDKLSKIGAKAILTTEIQNSRM